MRATRTTTEKAAAAKPYDRPAKGKGSKAAKSDSTKAEASASTSKATVNIGAPSAKQSSRKGKKAWRKNVDITAEETALETAREEERVTGGKIDEKKDGELFTIDTTGDIEVARKVRVKKPLRSLAILNERSAVPSLTSRVAAPKKEKKSITTKEKNHIRRIARKTADTSTSADIRTVDTSSLTDAWGAPAPKPSLAGGFGDETVFVPKPKQPKTLAKLEEIRRAAAAAQLAEAIPTTGVSYNPAAEAHAALISEAVEEEKARLEAEKREAERLAVLGEVVATRRDLDIVAEEEKGMIQGMKIGLGDGVDEAAAADSDSDAEPGFKPKQTKRKTQAQRNKALRAREAKEAAKREAERKRLEKAIPGAKTISKTVEARQKAQEEAKRLRKLAAAQRERMGFAGGEKIGKHRVGKKAIDVQLGEDLAESLRQVKPEGNLFKNHFLNLQRRALVEPRAPQLPKKRVTKIKEYEKHAWKRFE